MKKKNKNSKRKTRQWIEKALAKNDRRINRILANSYDLRKMLADPGIPVDKSETTADSTSDQRKQDNTEEANALH